MDDPRDLPSAGKTPPVFVSLTSAAQDEAWRRESKKAWMKPISIIAFVVAAAVGAYLYIPFKSPCDDPEQAYDASKDFFLRRLKSPSTANMPSNLPSDAGVSGLSCNFTVAAYADAENSFGARGRVWYIAEMAYNLDRRRWEMNDIAVDPPEAFLRPYRGW
jgi:hypothetical protein